MIANYADIQKTELNHIKIYIDYDKVTGSNFDALGTTSNITNKIQYATTIQKYLSSDSRLSVSDLDKNQLAAYNNGMALAAELNIDLNKVQNGDEFFRVTLNESTIYPMEIGSAPKGGGLNPVIWQEQLSKAVESLFHEVIAHITERVKGSEKAADHNKYFDYEKFIEFYGSNNIEKYMKNNTSPSDAAPGSRAGMIRTDVDEAVKQVELNHTKKEKKKEDD